MPSEMEVIILHDFADFTGGGSAVALGSARKLAAGGIPVTVFSVVGPIAESLKGLPNLDMVCLGQPEFRDANRFRAFIQGAWNTVAADALERLLRTKDPARTIVHTHLWMKALTPSVYATAFKLGFKVVITLHDFFIVCPNGGLFVYPTQELCHRAPMSLDCITCSCDRRFYAHKLWRVGRTWLQNSWVRVPEKAAYFIGVSEFSLHLMEKFLPPAIPRSIVRNPIECEDLGPAPAAQNEPFVFVGRLVPEKGTMLFAAAARRAGARAVFVGDGELRPQLERDFPEMKITGWQTPAQVTEWLRRARALVFPSTWYETLGMVVVEAAANGLPVIVADGCAARDVVADGERGLHFTHRSEESLADKIRLLQDDPALAGRLGRNAYEWYQNDPWRVDAHVDELMTVYRKILAPRLLPAA
jgi:glycosyltransferase involved in cell wall biosynthesis